MSVAVFPHIEIDEKGFARIEGARIKVTHLVKERAAYKWTLEEIQEAYPQLSLAQVYSAFAYYFDHKAELDAVIEKEHKTFAQLRAQRGDSPLARKMRAMKSSKGK